MCNWRDKIKEKEMSWVRGTYRRKDMSTMFRCEKLKQRDHLEDLGADGRVLKWNLNSLYIPE
jgi:hypothetical protein